jgi:hypothetical protein
LLQKLGQYRGFYVLLNGTFVVLHVIHCSAVRGKVVNLRGIPEELIHRAKAVSAWRGKTLKAFIIECLEKHVAEEQEKIHQENARAKKKARQ